MPRSFSLLAAVVILGLVFAGCSSRAELGQDEQTSYVEDNQRLLDSLPQIPGSQRIDVHSNPYCSAASPTGFSTFEHRRTTNTMSHDEIVAFYTDDLGGEWEQAYRYDVPLNLESPPVHGTDTEVGFRRGEEMIFLAMIPVEGGGDDLIVHSPNDYSVGVDAHRDSGPGCDSG